ncbi:hypothetical protein EC396_10845 [Lutibacter sp. HS1-25]|uniref:hypothetical protein n=1 Tax=Lutibacter sp. HS1-25 TaxID=2485000 RepID=UPI0010120B7A|nr:hypothetical protein [Lutibacter sp. HS1-25]RXP52803.1 hypothetical protein EC396_10845 [Lutibacter sp. HS1-25]
MKNQKFILFTLLFTVSITFGQTITKLKDTSSISNQFENLIQNANKYQDFRVVKTSDIYKLKSNVTDSIAASRKKLLEVNSMINSQKITVDSLQTSLNTAEETIITLNKESSSIGFLGLRFQNNLFKTIMLSIIAILAILLAFFIYKFKASNTITQAATENLKELEAEFETHRKTALEREQKVRRQLQDELNKNKKEK